MPFLTRSRHVLNNYYLYFAVAPDRPIISYEHGNAGGADGPENYQQDMGITIVFDEGSPSVTLVCRVNGGK